MTDEKPWEKYGSSTVVDEVKPWEKYSGISTEAPSEIPVTEKRDFSALNMIKNIPRSGIEMGKSIVSAVAHPIETGKAIGKTALGGVEKLIPGKQDAEVNFDALTQFLKERYGSVENAKKTIEEDPVGFAADLSTVFSGSGAALKAVPKMGEVASILSKAGRMTEPVGMALKAGTGVARAGGEVLAGGLGLTTGAGAKTMKEALLRPTKALTEQMRGAANQDDIVKAAEKGFQALKQERADSYVRQMNKVVSNTKQIDLTPIKAELQNQLQKFNVKQFVGKDGAVELDFTRSPINKKAASEIEEIVKRVEDWGSQPGDNTAQGLDILKRQLDDFYSDSSEARRFTATMKNKVKGQIIKEVPKYEKMVKYYELASNQLKDIKSAFSVGGKAGSDTKIRKLTQTLRQNFEFRNKLAKELGGDDLISMIAGNQLNPVEPRGLQRVVGAGGIVGAGAGLFNPAMLGSLVLTSPRLMGEFLVALGIPTRMLGNTLRSIYKPGGARALYLSGQTKKQTGKGGTMKIIKSIFLLAAISLPKFLYAANAYSTGTYVFTLPSTSTSDSSKSWATKNNDNWQAAGTALTSQNSRLNSVATDTSTVFTNLKSTAVQLSNYITFDLTAGATTSSRIDGLQTSLSTSDVQQNRYVNFRSTTDSALSAIVSTYTVLTTTGIALEKVQVSISSISAFISGGAMAIYSAGVVRGNATTLNFTDAITATCSGSTCTATATASGGGGGGNSTTTVILFHSGGQVFLATSPFVAIDGLAGTPVIISTFHAITFQAYTMFPSTVAVAKFQIVKTTSTQGAFPWNNWGPQIHSSTSSLYGLAVSTTINFYPTQGYALHVDSIPTSGDFPRTYGIKADGWYDAQ